MGFVKAGEAHKAATAAVLEWIAEIHGERIAEWWFWEATPMPCGLPSEKQLNEGLQFAMGRWTVAQFQERIRGKFEYEMRQMKKYEHGD